MTLRGVYWAKKSTPQAQFLPIGKHPPPNITVLLTPALVPSTSDSVPTGRSIHPSTRQTRLNAGFKERVIMHSFQCIIIQHTLQDWMIDVPAKYYTFPHSKKKAPNRAYYTKQCCQPPIFSPDICAKSESNPKCLRKSLHQTNPKRRVFAMKPVLRQKRVFSTKPFS